MLIPKPPKLFHRHEEEAGVTATEAGMPLNNPQENAEHQEMTTAPVAAVTPAVMHQPEIDPNIRFARPKEGMPVSEAPVSPVQNAAAEMPEKVPEPMSVSQGAEEKREESLPEESLIPEEESVYPTDMDLSGMNPEETKTEEDKVELITAIRSDLSDSAKLYLGGEQRMIHAPSVSSIPFADIWYTAEKIAYIRDTTTKFALIPFESDDIEDFYKALEQGFTGASSYAIRFAGEAYRVERIMTLTGPQYNCRKMPGKVPDIYTLGLPKHIVDYLLTLSQESGLILFGGPTGMGKTTSASALMKKFLEMDGGFMYTVEDPPEMPLDGLYQAKNGGLGLCKQCPVENERWGDGIKSALRSRPRYILVGEIRTPETASQVLRAATSGHLVLSTIHASTVEDALESIIKYASGAGLTESLAADLLARGILATIHQRLEGVTQLRPVLTAAFANPRLAGGDQMRSLIRNNTINLQTLIEAQSSRLFQGRPLFSADEREESL